MIWAAWLMISSCYTPGSIAGEKGQVAVSLRKYMIADCKGEGAWPSTRLPAAYLGPMVRHENASWDIAIAEDARERANRST